MRTATLWAAVAVLALLAGACGGAGDSGAGEPPAGEATVVTGGESTGGEGAQGAVAAAGDPAVGEELFVATCAACHGEKAEGVTGLGKDMTTSEFIAGLDDAGLVSFIKAGRGTDDPMNTTGVAMPVKGGNPALTDEQLLDIVAYIRTLQK